MAPGPPWGLKRCQFPASVGAIGRPRWSQHQGRGNKKQKRMRRDSFPAFRMPNEDPNMLGNGAGQGAVICPRSQGSALLFTPVSLFRMHHLILESGLETRFLLGITLDSVNIQVSPDCEELERGSRM